MYSIISIFPGDGQVRRPEEVIFSGEDRLLHRSTLQYHYTENYLNN